MPLDAARAARTPTAALVAGHHQYPPPRPSKTVAGLQFSKAPAADAHLHTTLGFLVPGNLPRSRYAAWNLLRVHLLWYNPWYIISGYAEVNVRKDSGLEHPMWLTPTRARSCTAPC